MLLPSYCLFTMGILIQLFMMLFLFRSNGSDDTATSLVASKQRQPEPGTVFSLEFLVNRNAVGIQYTPARQLRVVYTSAISLATVVESSEYWEFCPRESRSLRLHRRQSANDSPVLMSRAPSTHAISCLAWLTNQLAYQQPLQ